MHTRRKRSFKLSIRLYWCWSACLHENRRKYRI